MKQFVFAVSGVKNSGKTTLITKIIEEFVSFGLKVATIKHDGHEFDVQNTDTYKHIQSGASATAIFSENRFMVLKNEKTTEKELILQFKDYDIVILEGFKNSSYPKIEVVRKGNSFETASENPFLIATDVIGLKTSAKVLDINDIDGIVSTILEKRNDEIERRF